MKHASFLVILIPLALLTSGCTNTGAASPAPATPEESKKAIESNSNMSPEQKDAAMKALKDQEMRKQIEQSGNLPNGEKIPGR